MDLDDREGIQKNIPQPFIIHFERKINKESPCFRSETQKNEKYYDFSRKFGSFLLK